jgi:two-component system LytT family response regulator
MIKAVIIDDEKDARFLLRNQLVQNFAEKVQILGEADDVDSGVQLILKEKPEVVFLDVQMKNGTGFDLLRQFEEINFEVIFITAYNQYAIEAFKFSAFGYLLKPIKTSELRGLVEKLDGQLRAKKEDLEKKLTVLIENYGSNGEIQKLIIPSVEGFTVVAITHILRLEGDRNYTHFILLGGKRITASKSLGNYEELLHAYGFFRVHQSTIISLRHVVGYQKGDGGLVEMVDGAEVKVSRHRKADFLARFQ